jgi:hypothetical protein
MGKREILMLERGKDFQYFIRCFTRACKLIAPHYFNIAVAPSGDTVNRERVYCYELYNQLRNTLGMIFQNNKFQR